MIHVLAMITTKPGQRETVLAAFRANMPAVHAEKGCIEYAPAVDAPDFGKIQTTLGPDTFVVIEKWATAEDLKAHSAAPHMAAYGAKVKTTSSTASFTSCRRPEGGYSDAGPHVSVYA